MKKIALITGITGQDGSYLAELLLKKNYIVHGVKRRSSIIASPRIDHLRNIKNFNLHYGDLADFNSIFTLIKKIKPHEIYNLAAQSHVAVSFSVPEYSADINAIGVLRILESIRIINPKIKFYQAGTSELYGKIQKKKQDEKTKFYPRSPYAAAKLYAHWIGVNYREAYGLFVCNGILFNHESERRGENFVTRKITQGMARIKLGLQKELVLGNLEAKRDWGYAKDYVEAMWLILNKKNPNDYVISTGEQRSVKQFINETAKVLKMKITWKGQGINTKAYDQSNRCIIRCGKKYFRKSEVDELLGDNSKAKKYLKWKPKTNFRQLVKVMALHDLKKESEYNVSQKK
tara:strand:+ start:2543 stop:3580 length:1038 start_codon:yes stop_codon:yes gene_type:complete